MWVLKVICFSQEITKISAFFGWKKRFICCYAVTVFQSIILSITCTFNSGLPSCWKHVCTTLFQSLLLQIKMADVWTSFFMSSRSYGESKFIFRVKRYGLLVMPLAWQLQRSPLVPSRGYRASLVVFHIQGSQLSLMYSLNDDLVHYPDGILGFLYHTVAVFFLFIWRLSNPSVWPDIMDNKILTLSEFNHRL